MKNKFRLILPIIAAVFSLSSCDGISIGDKRNKEYGGYYKGVNLKLTGSKLASALQTHSFKKHANWVTYADVNSYLARATKKEGDQTILLRDGADSIEHASNKYQYFYTGITSTDLATKEHVWPCASSSALWEHANNKESVHNVDDESNYVGGGSDLYHIRTCDTNVNTARGNGKFVDFDDPEFKNAQSTIKTYPTSGEGWKLKVDKYPYSTKVEPDDNMKGDIARIIIYVWMHYCERGVTPSGSVKTTKFTVKFSDMTGLLGFSGVMGYSDVNRCKEVLKAWNKLDAPSATEVLRNDTVQQIQGNRNPFVDFPELVDQII